MSDHVPRRLYRASTRHRFGLVIFWAVLILGISSIPDLSSPVVTFRLTDKVVHFIEYSILGFFLAFALIPPETVKPKWRTVAVLLTGVLFGCMDELYQHLIPGRTTDPLDVAADAVGVIMGVILWRLLRRKTPRSVPKGSGT